jgi:hypothetical protein
VLINRILRDLASLEADVTAHAEAVLQGRLSKSQRKLIHKEQLKYSSTPVSSTHAVSAACRLSAKPSAKVSKSRSFRDGSKTAASGAKARQAVKYKKNKTTNLDRLSAAGFAAEHEFAAKLAVGGDEENGDEERRLLEASPMIVTSSHGGVVTTTVAAKKKTSFIQNVSSMLKNIR